MFVSCWHRPIILIRVCREQQSQTRKTKMIRGYGTVNEPPPWFDNRSGIGTSEQAELIHKSQGSSDYLQSIHGIRTRHDIFQRILEAATRCNLVQDLLQSFYGWDSSLNLKEQVCIGWDSPRWKATRTVASNMQTRQCQGEVVVTSWSCKSK